MKLVKKLLLTLVLCFSLMFNIAPTKAAEVGQDITSSAVDSVILNLEDGIFSLTFSEKPGSLDIKSGDYIKVDFNQATNANHSASISVNDTDFSLKRDGEVLANCVVRDNIMTITFTDNVEKYFDVAGDVQFGINLIKSNATEDNDKISIPIGDKVYDADIPEGAKGPGFDASKSNKVSKKSVTWVVRGILERSEFSPTTEFTDKMELTEGNDCLGAINPSKIKIGVSQVYNDGEVSTPDWVVEDYVEYLDVDELIDNGIIEFNLEDDGKSFSLIVNNKAFEDYIEETLEYEMGSGYYQLTIRYDTPINHQGHPMDEYKEVYTNNIKVTANGVELDDSCASSSAKFEEHKDQSSGVTGSTPTPPTPPTDPTPSDPEPADPSDPSTPGEDTSGSGSEDGTTGTPGDSDDSGSTDPVDPSTPDDDTSGSDLEDGTTGTPGGSDDSDTTDSSIPTTPGASSSTGTTSRPGSGSDDSEPIVSVGTIDGKSIDNESNGTVNTSSDGIILNLSTIAITSMLLILIRKYNK